MNYSKCVREWNVGNIFEQCPCGEGVGWRYGCAPFYASESDIDLHIGVRCERCRAQHRRDWRSAGFDVLYQDSDKWLVFEG